MEKKSRERKRERRLIKVAGKEVLEYEKSRGKGGNLREKGDKRGKEGPVNQPANSCC